MPSGPERLAQGFLEVDRASAHPCCHLNCQSPKPGRGVNGQAGREQSTDQRIAGCQPCPTDRRSRHTQSEVDLTFQSPLPGLCECFYFPRRPPLPRGSGPGCSWQGARSHPRLGSLLAAGSSAAPPPSSPSQGGSFRLCQSITKRVVTSPSSVPPRPRPAYPSPLAAPENMTHPG